MGCAESKRVVKQLELENSRLKSQLAAQGDAKVDAGTDGSAGKEAAATLQKEVSKLEREVIELKFKLEASHDLHACASLDAEKAHELLQHERRITQALKHHIVTNTTQVHSLKWGASASRGAAGQSSGGTRVGINTADGLAATGSELAAAATGGGTTQTKKAPLPAPAAAAAQPSTADAVSQLEDADSDVSV